MKLSIIVSVYNITAELGQCVSSLLRQDGRDGDENNAAPLSGQETGEIEVILVDDGSTDPSCRALCDRYAGEHPGLIRAIHRPNGGPGAARNTGVEAASGEYLTFVDGDDYEEDEHEGHDDDEEEIE